MGLLLGVAGKAEAATVSRVADIYPGIRGSYPGNLTVFDNALYFRAIDGVHPFFGLWKYDRSAVSLVTDPNIYLRNRGCCI
jgi:hypothetical protein